MSGSSQPHGLWYNQRDEAALRSAIRAQLAIFVPAHHLDIVADLTIHAARQAIEAIDRTCNSYDDQRVFLASVAPALSIVHGRTEQLIEATKAFAASEGMSISERKVTL